MAQSAFARLLFAGLLLALPLAHAAPTRVPLTPGMTFFWQLQGKLSSSKAKVLDVDGFDTPAATIAALKRAGTIVICYFSFGTWEDWRPDSASFPDSVKGGGVCRDTDESGKCTGYWTGERWVDTRSQALRSIMAKRIDLAQSKQCDGIEPDNLDPYSNNIGDPRGKPVTRFTLTEADAVDYLKWMADTVHSKGMSIGLKNAPEVASQVAPWFDWALNEQCNEYSDYAKGAWYPGKFQCDYLNLFVRNDKAAFVAEYTGCWGKKAGRFVPRPFCSMSNAHGFTAQVFDDDLTGKYFSFGDCSLKRPKSCAPNTWQECRKPAVYSKFKTNARMQEMDLIGQCVRSRAAQYCPYA